jgi:hypothetical protein
MVRTAVYVDGGLFTEAVRGQGMSMDMDLMGLIRKLTSGTELSAVHFVVPTYPAHPYPKKSENEKRQLEKYSAQGVSVICCQPQVIGSIFVDRGIEATITALAIVEAYSDSFDKALFISSRAELSHAVQTIARLGKAVEVAFFKYETAPSNPLEQFAAAFTQITIEDIVSMRLGGPVPYPLALRLGTGSTDDVS